MTLEGKQRLFIYDRKELVVLLLIGTLVGAFAFTLGVHLGKKSAPFKGDASAQGDVPPVGTLQDKSPNRQELNEQAKGVPQAVDESLNQALHEEVQRVGIKLATPRPVDLPNAPKVDTGGATTAENTDKSHSKDQAKGSTKDSDQEAAAPHVSRYSLQVGSFPSLGEAQAIRESLEARGLAPSIRSAELPGKGTWYRVFVGSYATKDEAEQLGARYQAQKFIQSFIVTQVSE